jgi:hypothetical protein
MKGLVAPYLVQVCTIGLLAGSQEDISWIIAIERAYLPETEICNEDYI